MVRQQKIAPRRRRLSGSLPKRQELPITGECIIQPAKLLIHISKTRTREGHGTFPIALRCYGAQAFRRAEAALVERQRPIRSAVHNLKVAEHHQAPMEESQ